MAVTGDLKDLSLTDLIQLNCQAAITGRLRVEHGSEVAQVFFAGGTVVHTALGEREGKEAFYEILGWESGTFELEQGPASPTRTITTPWSDMLLEGLHRLDESRLQEQPDGSGLPELQALPEDVGELFGFGNLSGEESLNDLEQEGQTEKQEVVTMAVRKRGEALSGALNDLLASSSDIEGALVVSADGLVLASNLPKGLDETRVGASAAALLGLSKRSTPALGRGEFSQSLIQGEDGNLIIVSAGERAIFVGLTPKDANLGMIFMEARDAAEAVAGEV